MSIRYKIFAAFSALVAVVCLVALVGFKAISETGTHTVRIFDGPLMAINYARAAEAAANEARLLVERDLGEVATARDVARFGQLIAEAEANLAVVRERSDGSTSLPLLEQAEQRLRKWAEVERSVMSPPAGGLTAVPARFALERMSLDAIAALDDLVETVAAEGFDLRRHAETHIAEARTTMLSLVAASLGIAIILSTLFTRSMSRPILTAMNVAGRVASGNFSDAIDSSRRDEFGNLLRSLDAMQNRLKARAEEERQQALARNRLSQMHAALSASSEAIMRANSREELYELVCRAVAEGGEFASISIALADEGAEHLVMVAAEGPGADAIRSRKLATTRGLSEGPCIIGTAFRSRQPCISNDYLTDDQFAACYESAQCSDVRSAAALPLLSRSKAIGVVAFQSVELNYFTPEMVELLGRLATNVSLALEDFDRTEERERAEEEMRYLATHDSLTGLPNRALLSELLGLSMGAARRYERKCAVLFIDLDRFKIINDTLGHEQGDALLIEVSRRLKSSVRSSDVVARLGGDEFVVLLNEITEQGQVAEIARKLLEVLGTPVELAGQECGVTASIGVAMFPDDGADQEQLLKNADVAMYLAKQEGKNDFRFYSNNIKAPSSDRIKIEAHLRRALERNELFLEYQPKQSTTTGGMIGVEALLRWRSPELGLMAPMQFIPIAEETGMIVQIGRWVLHTACKQAAAWQREGLPPLSMAVNLSPRQFSHEHLLDDIDKALAESKLDPSLLQVEVTESMVMIDVERAIELLDAIQSRGVRLAVDDFGTGYSSMSVMKRFPIDTIKIDRSFVRDLPENEHDKAITQAIIRMGKALGLSIVAEGVETIEQNAFLHRLACDEIQGFYYSRPLPPEAIAELCQGNAQEAQKALASMSA